MRRTLLGLLVACFIVFSGTLSRLAAQATQATDSRNLANGWEIHREITIDPASQALVKDYFPSFLDFHDMVMFHPKFGYYASGRVNFSEDYQTFPIVLAPVFGDMLAEHLFHMWDGMRKAGTLGGNETFTIGEFGAGNGVMAESILDYIQHQAATNKDPRWAAFAKQAMYVCFDRSPALNEVQKQRNQRFGERFDGRIADATDLTSTIAPGSLKGVVLSNELPDAFSVHKVIITASGDAEVAFVLPSLPAQRWKQIRTYVSDEVAAKIDAGDAAVEKNFFKGIKDSDIYLTKDTFSTLLEATVTRPEYESVATALEFREIYVPASNIPEVAAHLRRYAPAYANILATKSQGIVTYINLGAEKMIQGSAQILKAGYVLTIDYGSTWEGVLDTESYEHFRTYGPAHRAANSDGMPVEVATSDPYDAPTLNDMTTDVNFSLLTVVGEQSGLRELYYGSQRALQSGTSLSLERAPETVVNEGRAEKFYSWATDFQGPSVYKVLVQQKDGTDAKYSFPDREPEPLGLGRSGLSGSQLKRADEITKRLAGTP